MLIQFISLVLFLLVELCIYFILTVLFQQTTGGAEPILNPVTFVIVFLLTITMLLFGLFKVLPEHTKLHVARGIIYGVVFTLLSAIAIIVKQLI